MNQFQKTEQERAAIKAAKKTFKQNKPTLLPLELLRERKPEKEKILDGIMEGEDVLPNGYKVFADYCYVAEFSDGTGKVFKSDYTGYVGQMKEDLKSYPGYKGRYKDIVNIRNCQMGIRNLF